MSVVLFDCYSFIKRLTAVGMPEAQAEVLADEHARLIDERLATKSDIAALATRMDSFATKSDVAALATRLDAFGTRLDTFATKDDLKVTIAEAKTDITKWMFGTIGFQTVIILGAVVALAKTFH